MYIGKCGGLGVKCISFWNLGSLAEQLVIEYFATRIVTRLPSPGRNGMGDMCHPDHQYMSASASRSISTSLFHLFVEYGDLADHVYVSIVIHIHHKQALIPID